MYRLKKNIKVVIIMKNLFSIGEVSKIKGVTIKALRYYHKMGILIHDILIIQLAIDIIL
ncbi:merR regulatory family protein [[Clostridium] sordellii ATCC 9714]|nr:merR regulatory family protein [[Clostridium] sordellii ATCC 9714] [Paeniclostridium sordellii ATCC 9714]